MVTTESVQLIDFILSGPQVFMVFKLSLLVFGTPEYSGKTPSLRYYYVIVQNFTGTYGTFQKQD